MTVHQLTLPLGPSDNGYYTVARGRKILSAAGRAYKEEVGWIVKQLKLKKLEGDLWIVARFFPASARRFDATNRAKALHDALNDAGLFDDDSQIKDAQQKTDRITKGGRVEVLIGEIPKNISE